MTAQPPLNLVIEPGMVPIGEAAALVEDADGGRVFVYGNLVHAWDEGEDGLRRLAAITLIKTNTASVTDVAAGFGITQPTLWRWRKQLETCGLSALVEAKRGPKGPSRVTPAMEEEIARRRADGQKLHEIATATGVAVSTVGRIAARALTTNVGAGAQALNSQAQLARVRDCGARAPDASSDHGDQDLAGSQRPGLPVLPAPVDRSGERALARTGLIPYVRPVLAPAGRVPLAGLFLALPAVESTGLLRCATEVFGGLPNGYYGLETMLLEAVLRTLAGEPRVEGATRIDPVALGRILGMDRAPEVKTIRRKLSILAHAGKGAELQELIARAKTRANDEVGLAAVLYVDGHIRAYYGTRKIAKQHSTRLKFPAPATAETWVSDGHGDPVLVVMAPPGTSLVGELRRLLPTLREVVGDDRRVLVGFDREGWSPTLFAHMYTRGFDVLTWRKGNIGDIENTTFTKVERVDPDTGRTRTWDVAEATVALLLDGKKKTPIPDGDHGRQPGDKEPNLFWVRQITARVTNGKKGTRQIHLITTRTDLTAAEALHTMSSRWRQENHFRYGRMHFDLDSHDSYTATLDDPTRMVPNPAKKLAYAHVTSTKEQLKHAETAFTATQLDARTQKGKNGADTLVVTNADHNVMIAPLVAAEEAHTQAVAAHQLIPARIRLGELAPGQQVLEVETKLLTHTIRMAAFNTMTMLARDLRIHTDHGARATDKAHTLIRQLLTQPGDIDPDHDTNVLTIRLDALPTRRATTAAAELCHHLNTTQTIYPGTDWTLRYEIKPADTLRK